MQRHRSVPQTFEGRMAAEKARLEARVAEFKPGPTEGRLLEKIRQLETASRINERLTSPGLKAPKLVENLFADT
jgi:hypothetical protein